MDPEGAFFAVGIIILVGFIAGIGYAIYHYFS